MKKQVSEEGLSNRKFRSMLKAAIKDCKQKQVCNFCGRSGVALHPITKSCIKCGVLPERT